ncbi:unnamed protein product [Amoebophrya sp. A25]|nr:unnamed protein product [Amoebophrya sp. A25]|eukprot:GSA25T00020735001.1
MTRPLPQVSTRTGITASITKHQYDEHAHHEHHHDEQNGHGEHRLFHMGGEALAHAQRRMPLRWRSSSYVNQAINRLASIYGINARRAVGILSRVTEEPFLDDSIRSDARHRRLLLTGKRLGV